MLGRTLGNWTAIVVIGIWSLGGGLAGEAQADSWKLALHDANALFSASRSLHDRAEHFYDAQVLPSSARLEQMSAQLVTLLKADACPEEVVQIYRAILPALEDASARVQLSHAMRVDRRSQSVLADARRFYAATGEHLQCTHPPVIAPVVPLPRVSGYPTMLPYATPPAIMSAEVGGIRITPAWRDAPRALPVAPQPSLGPWNGSPSYRLQGYPDPVDPGTQHSSPHISTPRGLEIRFRLP